MKLKLYILFLFCIPLFVEAQEQNTTTDSNIVFTIVERMPQFPGGDEGLIKYLIENMKYPAQAKKNGISGTVYLTFVVNKLGNIEDAKVLRSVKNGEELNDEALRVIKSMPTWTPGTQNEKTVSVQYNLPIKFTL
jgi:protein TonB